MDDDVDDKDDTKRKSRNLSEKKRRDQFNMLVNELGNMVNSNARKMDKSTVLKSTILFLKNHAEIAVRSRVHEIQENWKPSFLSNEEFTHLILEALDGFIMVFSSDGRIYYASESVTSLLGYLPNELSKSTIYEITYQDDQAQLYSILINHENPVDQSNRQDNQITFTCHIKRGGLDSQEEPVYELVQFIGYFRSDTDTNVDNLMPGSQYSGTQGNDSKLVFVGTGRLQTPQLIRELSMVDNSKSEFTSRHSLEWKFLFLDHRAPPIIGYLPFEVLGTSGYDYYHIDDLDKVVICHESLIQKGEGTSCYYRFLTKGQQWIWLQTRFYITYNQWNSKPEFIVCSHRVVNYIDVIKSLHKNLEVIDNCPERDAIDLPSKNQQQVTTSYLSNVTTPSWSSSSSKASRCVAVSPGPRQQGRESVTTTISAESQCSRQSHQTHSFHLRTNSTQNVALKSVRKTEDHRKTEINESYSNLLDKPQYMTTIPVQPIVSAGFATIAPPIISPLQMPELIHQPSIVMTPAQNQIQDELQRKHEELQQLIVHQQEELRRVSEQLFIARYGILSPLSNVTMPYATYTTSPQANQCISVTSNTTGRLTSSCIQGVNVLPVPITLSVPLVPPERLSHPLPVTTTSSTSSTNTSNMKPMILNLQQEQSQLSQQEQPSQQEIEQASLMSFHVYQPTETVYTTMQPPGNVH
ncbi:circadian locomoter output cycles protein kaput isoform X2 [Cephus cinctus]|nr:circadian locomoter output cycles protein kaput isoform X2 [Cephus cinctus]